MVRDYETIFILTPVLSEVQMKGIIEKFKKILTENGTELINEENWGLRKLAYPIQHKVTGFYQLFEFRSNPELVVKLETEYRREEAVMRFLTVTLDKHAIVYNQRRKKGEFNKKKTKKN